MHRHAKKVFLALAISSVAGVAQADIVTGLSFSDVNGIRVGPSSVQVHGKAGVGLDGQFRDRYMAASHFAQTQYVNDHDVYNFSGREVAADMAARPGTRGPDHSRIGVWSFAQVGSKDVWFGEWSAESQTGAVGTKTPDTHTVWYVGENGDVAATLPAGAPVSYTIRSINHYTGSALPTSTLTANFDIGSAHSSGDIRFNNGSIKTIDRDVQLGAKEVSVASSGGTNGTLEGKFFGAGATGVAGIVKFTDRHQDTAFGGTKNP